MKALSLLQPWASLVALGEKRIETRSWSTPYRGWLAIHASKNMSLEAKALCELQPFAQSLDRVFAAGDELPLGAIVAVCKLVACITTDYMLLHKRGEEHGVEWRLNRKEYAFGNYADGRWGLVLDNVYRLDNPIPCRDALGLWDVTTSVLAEIESQMASGGPYARARSGHEIW